MPRPRSELGDIVASPRSQRLLRWMRRKPTPAKLLGETIEGEEVTAVVSPTGGPATYRDLLSCVRACVKVQALDKDGNVLRVIELDPDDPELRAEAEAEAAAAGLARSSSSGAAVPIISVDIPRLVDNIARNMREVGAESARQNSAAFKEGFTALVSVVNVCLNLLVRVEQRMEAADEEAAALREQQLAAAQAAQGGGGNPRDQLAMMALQRAFPPAAGPSSSNGNGSGGGLDLPALLKLAGSLGVDLSSLGVKLPQGAGEQ